MARLRAGASVGSDRLARAAGRPRCACPSERSRPDPTIFVAVPARGAALLLPDRGDERHQDEAGANAD